MNPIILNHRRCGTAKNAKGIITVIVAAWLTGGASGVLAQEISAVPHPATQHTAGGIELLAFLGDSITAGVGVKIKETDRYPAVTTRILKDKYPDIQEINLGLSGQALCSQPASYADGVLARKPDAVVIQWGVNDQFWGFSVAQFVSRYEQLVQALRTAKPEMPIVLTTLVADFRWSDNLDQWIGEANVAIQEIAARYKCRVAYVHRALDHNRALYADPIHPNNAGAELMAKAIVAAFDAPPLSNQNLAVQFDQGAEVRFMQYVFIPRREGTAPHWVRVTDISKSGLRIETTIPILIRTPPIHDKGDYRIVIRDKIGAVVDTIESKIRSKIISFTLDPKGYEGPFDISFKPPEHIVEKISSQ